MSHSRKRKEGIEHKRRASSSSSGVSSGSNSSRSSISSVNIENLTAHLKDVEDALIAENAAERRRQIHAEITGSQEVDTLVFLSTKDKLEEDEMNQAKGILNTIINHKQKDTSNTNMVMLDLLKTALIQLLKYHFPELTSASNNNKFKEKIISLTEEQLISIIADITRYISFNTLKILKEVTDSNKILAHKVITGFLIYKGEIELFLDISKKCNDFINRYNIKEKEIHKLTDEELNDILNSISTDALNDFIQQLRAIPPLKQSAELNETWLNYAIRARETRFPLKKDIISIHEISEKTEEVLKELNIAVENVRTKRQYIERFGLTEAVSYLLSSVDKYLSQKLTVLGEEGDAETIKKGYMNCLNNFNREINYIIEKSEDENTKKTIKHAYRNFLNCIDVLINEERDRIATQKRGTLNITDIPIATGMLTDIQKSIDNAQNIEEYKDNLKLDEFKSQSSMANAIISLAEKYLNMIPKKKAVKGEVGYEEEEIRYTEFVKSLNNAKATALKRLEEGKKPYEKDENPQTWNTKAQIESRYEEEFDRIKRKEEEEKRKAEEAQRKAEEKERKEAERRAKEEAKAIKAKEAKERKEQYELMMKGDRKSTRLNSSHQCGNMISRMPSSA